MNKLNHVNGNATAAGIDLDGELIFITNNPVKIIYPKKSSRRPEGAEIEEADNGAIVEEKVEEKKSINTLRLEKVASLALKEDDQGLIETFVKSETFSINSTTSEIKEAYKMFESNVKWIIYDKKTGKQLSPTKSWGKWQGAKMAAAKIGGNAEPTDAAWYHDNKAKLMGEATDLNEVSAGKLALLDTQQLMTFYTIFSRVSSPRGKEMTQKLKRELSKRDDFNESTDLDEEITLKDVIRGGKAVGRALKKSASVAKVFLKATIAVSKKVGGAIGELMSDPEFQAIFKKYSEDPTDERSLKRAQMYLDPKFGDSQSPHFSESTDLDEAKQYVVIDKRGKVVSSRPMSTSAALDHYDSLGGNAKGYKVVATGDKRIKESTDLEEAFSRLPGHVINNELYVANRALQAFASSQTNGDDVDEKKLNQLIKNLQDIKKQIKKFNKPEDVPLSYQYKESVDLEEGSDYPLYHSTFTAAAQAATNLAKKRGFEIDDDDWFNQVSTGPKKPGKGKTNRYIVKVTKNGKETKKRLAFQVYGMDSGKYELNAYVESTQIEEATDKELDIKDLEKMIKNPDRKRVKSYGGTKYVDMLKSKLAKLKESTDLDEAKQYVVIDKRGKVVSSRPMSTSAALDHYDSLGGNAKGYKVVATGDKRIKESTDLEEGKKVVASVELWNGKKMKKSFAKQSAAEAWVKKMEDNEDVRDYKMHAESTDLEEAATWKSEGHYTADGKEWTGDQHEVDGQVMTGKVHSDDSVNLYHFKELTPEVRKKVAASFK
jgi:hypothetical protein